MKNVQLHQTFWFWLSILAPVALSLALSSLLCSSNDISVSWKAGDLNELLKTFQIPLGILSLSIPFVAVTAAIHRSAQTARQIEAQQSQNNFINHFKHLEEFKKSMPPQVPLGWENIESFHHTIYPNSAHGDFTPAPLSDHPLNILATLCSSSESKPLETLALSRSIYRDATLGLKSLVYLDKNVIATPKDTLFFFQQYERAITITGLNSSIEAIPKDITTRVDQINTVAEQLIVAKSNLHIVRDVIKSNDSAPWTKSLSFINHDLYRGLAVAYAWALLPTEEKEEIVRRCSKKTYDYIQSDILKIQEISLKEYGQRFNRQSGTIQSESNISY